MRTFFVVLLLTVVGACGGVQAPVGTRPEAAEVKPEPGTTVGEFRSEEVGGGRYRVWPRSAEVEDSGVYRYTVEHCGLEWLVDFDASFWNAIRPEGAAGPRFSFFYNSDTGTISFRTPDHAIYTSSEGADVELRRIDGPVVIRPCG